MFWVPGQLSSLREAPERTERDRDSCPVYTFANPVRFVAFNPTSLECSAEGKMMKERSFWNISVVIMAWFRGLRGNLAGLEQTLVFFVLKNQTRQTS